MSIVDIILKKRDGGCLTSQEIHFFVRGVKEGTVPDYQTAALLMAIYFEGMSSEEVATLTKEMALSGDTLTFPSIEQPIVDKHSSGGVGDKTSLIIAPIVAACGLPIAKLSGRGLGFTGGTIDKLESIPGFRTELSTEEFMSFVARDGIALMGQTADIAPVDKVLYALRDVTGTVDSVPLIAASIMSKKLADGSDAIVLDVKCGSGAFMKTPDEAIHLAEVMVGIGEDNGKKTIALVTDMSQPLGFAVGNALEVQEAIDTLRGQGPSDLQDECLALSCAMLLAGGRVSSEEAARDLVTQVISSGAALSKLKTLIQNQGGDPSVVDQPARLAQASYLVEGIATSQGYVSAIDTEEIGKCSVLLGAGRQEVTDTIDPAVGLVIRKKVGDPVREGETLFVVHANDPEKANEAFARAFAAYTISPESVVVSKSPIYAEVTKAGVKRFDPIVEGGIT